MVRLSDILKKVQKKKDEELQNPEVKEIPSVPKEEIRLPQEVAQQQETANPEEISVAKAVTKMNIAQAIKEAILNEENTRDLYQKAMQLAKTLLEKLKKGEHVDIEEIDNLVRIIVDQLVLNNEKLILLASTDSPENYLYGHMVNVSIISLEIGLGLGYNKSQLNELGLAAFLHDIGMTKVLDLALAPRALKKEEYNRIKEHPTFVHDLAKNIEKIKETTVSVITQIHERINGKGYPNGLSDGDIDEFSQIVGVADVYEALSHERPYRKAYSLPDTVREIMASCGMGAFDIKIIRALINRVGVYPIGTWVELSSGEIGKVIRSVFDFPLRPVVNILFEGSDKRKIKTPKIVDLSKQHSIFIKRSLSDEEFKN